MLIKAQPKTSSIVVYYMNEQSKTLQEVGFACDTLNRFYGIVQWVEIGCSQLLAVEWIQSKNTKILAVKKLMIPFVPKQNFFVYVFLFSSCHC